MLLIWAVLPASDVPMEDLGGQGMEVGLGGVEGEGASGAPGGGEPQPSEAVPAESTIQFNPASEIFRLINPSAMGERQIFPKQTMRIRIRQIYTQYN